MANAEILLVQTEVGNWDKISKYRNLPLSLISVARLLPKDKVKLIDLRLDSEEKFLNELKKNPILVCFSSMTGENIKYAINASRLVKKFSSSFVVWGGIHPSLLPKQTLNESCIDFVVKGQGEEILLYLYDCLKKHKKIKGRDGLYFKDEKKVFVGKGCAIVDLEKLPLPAYELIDLSTYFMVYRGKKMLPIETSRGCPFCCSFCVSKNIFSNWRPYPLDMIISNIKYFSNVGVKHIMIIDVNFFSDINRVLKFAQILVDLNLGITWHAQGITFNDLVKLNGEDLNLLIHSGMTEFEAVGVESGSPRIQKSLNKNINLGGVILYNKFISKYGIKVRYNFFIGSPEENIADLKLTINLILRLIKENEYASSSILYLYTPYPGNKLFDIALSKGFIAPITLKGWGDLKGWDSANLPWLSRKRKILLEKINFLSMFLSTEYAEKYFSNNYLLFFLVYIYGIFARFRLKHLFFMFMPEKRVANWILKNY